MELPAHPAFRLPRHGILAAVLLAAGLAPAPAQATLIGAPGVNAVYDDALDVSWYTIAAFGTFATAQASASGFVLEVDGVFHDQWRLPTIDVDGLGDPQAFTGILCQNDPVGCEDNELAHLVIVDGLSAFSGFASDYFIFSGDTLTTVQGPSVWIQNMAGLQLMGTVTQASSAYILLVHDGNVLPEPASVTLLGAAAAGLAVRRRRARA